MTPLVSPQAGHIALFPISATLDRSSGGLAKARKNASLKSLFGALAFRLTLTHTPVEGVFAGVFRMLGHHFLDGLTWWLRLRTVSGHMVNLRCGNNTPFLIRY